MYPKIYFMILQIYEDMNNTLKYQLCRNEKAISILIKRFTHFLYSF